MTRLANKVAVITGGTSGIGAGTVRRFVQEGAQVILPARMRAKLKKLFLKLVQNSSSIKFKMPQAGKASWNM